MCGAMLKVLTVKCPFVRLLPGIWLFAVLSSAAVSQTPQDYLHSLVGQKLLLRHFGDVRTAKVKKDKLRGLHGTCDVAVLVKDARWDKGQAQLHWEQIGSPHLPGQPRRVCKDSVVFDKGEINVTGFEPDESPDSLAAALSLILQTPEQYLAAAGIPFNLPPQPDVESLGTPPVPPFSRPRPLLTVNPAFSEEARSAKYQGSLTISVYVGTDGRIHRPSIPRKLGLGLDENALSVLPLWRFEPARKQDKPVALQQSVEIDFRLY